MGDDPQPPPGADNGWGAPPPDGGGWGSPPADGGFGAGGGGAAGFGAGGSGAQHPGGGHQGPQPAGFGGPPPGMPPGFVPGAGQQVDTAVPWEIPGGGLFARWFDTLSAANFTGAAFYRAAGQSDDLVLEQMTAFSYAANLTGLPALSVPAGYDEGNLPIGIQLMGRHWEEATLLRCGLVCEQGHDERQPEVHFRLLP